MSARRGNAAIFGIGVAACGVCCAGPILGVLAAVGLGTAAGFALVGSMAILIGSAAFAWVLVRRRRGAAHCMPADAPAAVAVELTEIRRRS